MNARRREKYFDLPARMIAKPKISGFNFYYDRGAKSRPRYQPLGPNRIEALRQYAELEQGRAVNWVASRMTFRMLASQYIAQIIPTLAKGSQSEYFRMTTNLLEFFEDAPLAEIMPAHARQFRDRYRHKMATANRHLAVLSAMWNYGREWGMTDRENVTKGIKRLKEAGRGDVYITDAQFSAIYGQACQPLRDFMDLAYLTGQRPSDILAAREHDLQDGALEFQQSKTGKRLRITVEGEFSKVLDRIRARKATHKVHSMALVVTETGRAATLRSIQWRWVKASRLAGLEHLQARDLRAKGVSDKEAATDIREAQAFAGHATVTMTEHYSRNRRGQKISPVK